MKRAITIALVLVVVAGSAWSQQRNPRDTVNSGNRDFRTKPYTLYDVPPRFLVDRPTAGTLPRGYFDMGLRIYPNGGGLGYTNIGLSNRLQIGVSYGGEDVISARTPNWNPRVGFCGKFRLIDELQYFPAVSVGYCDQGAGAYNNDYKRYTFKSPGFFAVASRGVYFYRWTSSWHAGINYSMESDVDEESDVNFFLGFDATFDYNAAFLIEYDFGLDDNRGTLPNGEPDVFAGKGRGYLNMSVKWLFTNNFELELILKDLAVNRRESTTFTREVRMTYVDHF